MYIFIYNLPVFVCVCNLVRYIYLQLHIYKEQSGAILLGDRFAVSTHLF